MDGGRYDAIVIGAGAAGLMCALTAGGRGLRVLVLEHANKVGKKILMSGGGRCNFTNTGTGPANYLSANPHFCKSALARYTPAHFIEMVDRAKQYLAKADVVLVVIDGSRPLDESDREILAVLQQKPGIIALNKEDLEHTVLPDQLQKGYGCSVVSLSATQGIGLEKLKEDIIHL